MNFLTIYKKQLNQLLSDVVLLMLRIWLAQEFITAGLTKLSGGLTPPEWFRELSFPFPNNILSNQVNWVVAGSAELLFGCLLIAGLFGRLSALILLYITYVAVYTVHFDLGLLGWNQIETDTGLGFKVPLMIAVMLLVVLGQGVGRWSLDHWVENKYRNS
jgi:putative oxidoreductase